MPKMKIAVVTKPGRKFEIEERDIPQPVLFMCASGMDPLEVPPTRLLCGANASKAGLRESPRTPKTPCDSPN